MITLLRPTLPDLRFLCERARPDEIEQYEALTGLGWDAALVAADLFSRAGPQFLLLAGNTPIVAGGFQYMAPGAWDAWMVGTMAGWQQHWGPITRHTERVIRLLLRNERRVEITVLAAREQTCTWYERGLRMTREGVKRGLGVNGEDAVLYARIQGDR